MDWKQLFSLCSVGVLAGTLGACGGGSGSDPAPDSTILRGVAAAGAPIYGKVYAYKPSTGESKGPVNIDGSGNYSLNVSGLDAPFVVIAEGNVGDRAYRLASVVMPGEEDGRINITPFSDMVTGMATGTYGEYAENADLQVLTQADIDTIESDIKTNFSGVLTDLGVDPATVNSPRKDAFTANGTGMDKVLDALDYVATANDASVDVDRDGAADFTASSPAAVTVSTTTLTETMALFEACKSSLDGMLSDLQSGVAASTIISNRFDVNFLDDGENASGFLNGLGDGQGVSISQAAIISVDLGAVPKSITIRVTFNYNGKPFSRGVMICNDDGAGGALLAGNQRWGSLDISSYVAEIETFDRTAQAAITTFEGGINVILDFGNVPYVSDPSRDIAYATVEGPGLPATGVVLKPYITASAATDVWPFTVMNGTTNTLSSRIPLQASDLVGASYPFVYTVKLYDSTDTVKQTYQETLYDFVELDTQVIATDYKMPEITNPRTAGLLNGQTYTSSNPLNLAYSMPDRQMLPHYAISMFDCGSSGGIKSQVKNLIGDSTYKKQLTNLDASSGCTGYVAVQAKDHLGHDRFMIYRIK